MSFMLFLKFATIVVKWNKKDDLTFFVVKKQNSNQN